MIHSNTQVSKRSKQMVSKTIPKGSWVRILPCVLQCYIAQLAERSTHNAEVSRSYLDVATD